MLSNTKEESALRNLRGLINRFSAIPQHEEVNAVIAVDGGKVTYRRAAGDKMAVVSVHLSGDLTRLMKAMKIVTGDQSVEWAIAHVGCGKVISEADLKAGIESLTAIPVSRGKKAEPEMALGEKS